MTVQQIRERSSARAVLAVLIGLLAALLALEAFATVRSGGAFQAFAQATGTAPTIKIINPDSTTSTEISAKNDGDNTNYHLVAWISNAPASPVVQFKYQPEEDGAAELAIQCANTGTTNAAQVTGAADTYSCNWNLAGVEDGGGELRAELYDGANEVAQDAETVTVESEGQTVEIVWPRNGEEVGFYTGPDGIASGMIDVKTSAPGTPTDDEGTQRVTVYYSTSAPGTEPAFEECGTEDVTGGAQESIRCDMAEDDPETPERENDPSRITAVAATAGDTDEGPEPGICTTPGVPICDQEDTDSADAHRAFGYEQTPEAVSLNPQTQQVATGQCSQSITATVTDEENGRPIVGINVDVHAQGPSDNLKFDDSDDTDDASSPSKPADGHTAEAGADCEDTEAPVATTDGVQGDHDRVDNDIKHIESADDEGTNDEGKFSFKLYSVDAGTTQFTVWADADGDDARCTEEATGIGSIGWGQAAPSPTGVTEETTPCPTPTGTGSPTPTETVTQSPTGSPSSTAPATECSDGQDNDGDGQSDMNDTGCDSPEDDDEGSGDVVTSGPCQGYEEGSRQQKGDGGLVIVGTSGPDELVGGSGNDLICGLGGKDSIRGRGGADEVYGGGGHDDLRGNAGNDLLAGQGGLDVLRGGGGADVAKGGADNDTIRTFDGRDRLVGGKGDDTLRAGDGNDKLYGNPGADLLDGGNGRDLCRPGPGRDRKVNCER